jgi:hypothetical protein
MDYSHIDLKSRNKLAGIGAQVQFLRQARHTVYQQVREKLAFQRAPGRVYLVGCGDSW